MSAIKTLALLATGAMAISTAATAQTPYGGYGQSNTRSIPSECRNVETLANGYVSAQCPTEDGYRWSSIRLDDCRSALANRNGVLSCSGAQATVGPMYPAGQSATTTGSPSVIDTLLGAVFGTSVNNAQTLDSDWSRGNQPLGQRRAALLARIDAGVRDGSLTRNEADRLRSDYDQIVRLESQYSADGRLTAEERADLRDRYAALSQRVGDERQDAHGNSRWEPLANRRAEFDARVNAALNDRSISRNEATRLRSDFQSLMQIENNYQRGGLDARELADLNARYDALSQRIGDDGGDAGDRRWGQLEYRLAAAERSGANRFEVARLRTELGDLTRLDAAYRDDGLNADERAYLDRRFTELNSLVSALRR